MKTPTLALRNLLRNRRRSIATLLAMTFGLSAILVFGGYSRNVILALQTAKVQYYGHLQIQHRGYFQYGSGNPAAYGIAGYERIVELVRRDPVLQPMLTVVTPKLQAGGIAGNYGAGVSRNVIATGLVIEEQNQMLLWNDYGNTSYARPLSLTGTAADAAVVGIGVARGLQLCAPLAISDCTPVPDAPGASGPAAPEGIAALSAQEQQAAPVRNPANIEILATSTSGAPNVISLDVVKAENQGLKEFDDVFVAMHLRQAQQLVFGNAPPQASAIMVQLKHTGQLPAARARLQQLLDTTFKDDALELQDYATLNPVYGQTIDFFDSIFGFIAVLIGVIVLFTIGNTMSMAVVERTAEIGTLRAMGLRRGGIQRLFMCEGVLLGMAGAMCGLAASLAIAFLINSSGLSWTPPGYIDAFPVRVRVWGNLPLLFGSALGLILVTILSAYWPARRAARFVIVDALRHA